MNIGSFIVSFTVIWWILLFIILPIGIKREDDRKDIYFSGAPRKSNIMKKMLINTVISLLLSIVFELSIRHINIEKYLF